MIKEMLLQKLKGKIVIFDFDGVLATYQSTSDKVHTDPLKYMDLHMDSSIDPYEYTRAPSIFKEIISELSPDNVYVLSQVDVSYEARNKIVFLKEHYPSIKADNILFVAKSSYKVKVVQHLYDEARTKRSQTILKSDIVVVDDSLEVITSVEDAGFRCLHNSAFID